jgi:dipeptidyl aminopeptidase/acylaminoacyl peptidase
MKLWPLWLVIAGSIAGAQSSYQKPPKEILDVLNAPVTPTSSLSPTRDTLLLVLGVRYPPISELAQPMLRLAGSRINPATRGRHLAPYYIALTLKKLSDGSEIPVALPDGARIGMPNWSADGALFAFTNTTDRGIELWIGEAVTGKARRIQGVRINAAFGDPLQWMPDQRTLLVQLVPPGEPPAPSPVPEGPKILESAGKTAPVRTYQDLLKNAHDEALFDYYATSQPALVDAIAGTVKPWGAPDLYDAFSPAPDGKHILVVRLRRPFSYLHTASSFPREVDVVNLDAKPLYALARLPLADQVPLEGVRTGPRSFSWHPTEPATLLWVEALDGGDPKKKVLHRDRLLSIRAPFAAPPEELIKTEHRFAGLQWGERGTWMLLGEFDRDRRWRRTHFVDYATRASRLLWDLSANERYKHPGSPVTRELPTGFRAILQHGDAVYLQGEGATPEGNRPFLDRMDLRTFKTERLFRCDESSYESVVALLRDDASRILTRRETTKEPPNLLVRSGPDVRKLTNFADPAPILRSIKKQLVKYKRADGVDLSFTLYLPPDYKEGTRLPTVLWAYPREYTDPSTAGQVSASPHRFTSIGGPSHLFFVLCGYAILDDATLPVVGDPETVNNTYLEQVIAGAKAAIDQAAKMGVTDPARVGVGGHSYGAFMTANLLAHSDLFRAGIARSGAYNRTLTPFGFQSERRTLWEAPDMYIKVSPFMAANKINEPILLIHGEADNNAGTFPMQSERLYQALVGNGATVRYVTLPLESHGYSARESVEHTLFEMVSWFDRHVKTESPLSALHRKLNQGIEAILKGTDPAEAFKPWGAEASTERLADVRDSGAASAQNVSIDLSFILRDEGVSVHRLTVSVVFDGDRPRLEKIRGEEDASSAGVPIEEASGFAEAARAILKDPEVASKLGALKYDSVEIRIDEQRFAAFRSDGSRCGTIVGGFRFTDGKVSYRLRRFE